MNKNFEFLGQARGHEERVLRNDLKTVHIKDFIFLYSLDSDAESCAEHALKLFFEDQQETLTEEMIADVAEQLGISDNADEVESEITTPDAE